MAITYHAGRRIQGTDGDLTSHTLEITTDSHRVASSLHNTFSSGSSGQGNWYCYNTNSSGYRGAQQYTASQFSSIPSGATITGVKYSGGSQRYYGAQTNPKLVGMSTAPNSHTSVSNFISDVQNSSTIYVDNSGFGDSTYSGNGGTAVPFTDTFNSTGVAYVANAIANGDDVFFGFQSGAASGNKGYYGFTLTGTSQAKLTIEYTSGTAGDTKPTNVQEGSRFEATDTRKMYHYGKYPTFQDDFSSDNWTDVGTQIGVSGGKMAWNALRSGSNQGSYYDIGTANISETEWVLDFTLDIDAMTEGDTNAYFTIGLSSKSTMDVNTSQDFIGLLTYMDTSSGGNSRFMATGVNGGTTVGGNDFTTSDPQTLGLFYVRIRRTSATECKVAIYSDSDYKTLVEEETVTITSGLQSLRYLKLTNLTVSGAGTGVFNGTMDNVKFYNGVTSVSNTWKEIGV